MDEIITEVKKVKRGYILTMSYKFEQAASAFNMLISTSKTQCLTIAKEPLRCKLAVYGRSMEQVMNFKYLGVTITSRRDLEKEVKAQTLKAFLISGYLRDIIFRNKYMSV